MQYPQRSLVGGEIDPDLWYSSDLAPVRIGAAQVRNFIVRPQGGVERRPGTEHIAVLGAGQVQLSSFVRSSTESFVLLYSAYRLAVRHADGAGGEETALDAPWSRADLASIQTAQSNDVQWHVGENFAPLELRRYGVSPQSLNFELVDAQIERGPYRDMNGDEDRVVKIDNVQLGRSILTTNFDFFTDAHVGVPIRLEESEIQDVPSWGPGEEVPFQQAVRWNGSIYSAARGGTTTGQAPTHTRGIVADGPASDAVRWNYLHSGSGVVKITAIRGPREAVVDVIERVPGSVREMGTWLWQEGAWSRARGWPRAVALYKSALWFGGTQSDPHMIWKSAIEGFSDFAPGTEEDAALARGLYGGNTEAIRWMVPGNALVIGTDGPEWIARAEQDADTVRTNNLVTRIATNEGAAPVSGVSIGAATVFVDATRRALTSIRYDFTADNWTPRDLTIFAKHILGRGAVDIVFQRKPYPILWCLLRNGTLAGLTYLPEQDVLAWHTADVGGRIQSITVCPTDQGATESLFLAVERTVNGQEQVHLERMAQPWSRTTPGIHRGVFLDNSVIAKPTENPRRFTGLEHLAGETVSALVDGMAHPPVRVESDGAITLQYGGDLVRVGLAYTSRYTSLPFDAGAPMDFQAGKVRSIRNMVLRFRDTMGGDLWVDGKKQRLFSLGDTPLDRGPRPFTGLKTFSPPAAGSDGAFTYETNTAWPACITAAFMEYGV